MRCSSQTIRWQKHWGTTFRLLTPLPMCKSDILPCGSILSSLGTSNNNLLRGGAESAISARVLQPNDPTCRLAVGGEISTHAISRSNGTAQHPFARLETLERQQTRSIFKKKIQSDLGRHSTEKEPTALHRLQYQERLHSMPRVAWGGNLPITPSVLSYEQMVIPKDSVIYCDIPYEGTNRYNKAEGFDYERFYQWAESQTEPVFISSYQMPTDCFDCIEEFTHRSTLCATANNAVTERIFVPKHQTERGNICQQLTLF